MVSKTSQTVSRAVAILRAIARESFNGLRLSDICEITGLPQGTAHRLLQTLVAEGFVRQDGKRRRYGLGALNFELGLAISERPFFKQLRPKLERLSAASKETVCLFARSGSDVICIDRIDKGFTAPGFTEIGVKRPLCLGASGLALIARLRNTETNKIILANSRDIERHSLANMRSIKNEIRQARKRGYAVSRDLVVPGRAAVAVALPLTQLMPPLSVSVSTFTNKLTTAREQEFFQLIQQFML